MPIWEVAAKFHAIEAALAARHYKDAHLLAMQARIAAEFEQQKYEAWLTRESAPQEEAYTADCPF